VSLGLLFAALLAALVAVAHSVLGERYILVRLFRRADLPRLFGNDRFTRRTLRFAWHLTSIAWLGFAALLGAFAAGAGADGELLLRIVAATFLVHALVTAAASRGRHVAWIVFLAIAALSWAAT
jgi:hypothetical protein